MSDVIEQVEAYSYSPIRPGHPDRVTWGVTVENVGMSDQWAVRNGSRCANIAGEWIYEPQPSSRTDEWLAEYRFPLLIAQALAHRICGSVTWNGWTADQLAAKHSRVAASSVVPPTKEQTERLKAALRHKCCDCWKLNGAKQE